MIPVCDNKISDSYSPNHFNNCSNKILQVDGNDSLDSIDDENDNSDNVCATNGEIVEVDPNIICAGFDFDDSVNKPSPKNQTVSNKTASFSLNKEKQIQNLGVDSNLPDFEIMMNDNDRNVNIQCSSAYYDAVAKPVLCGLTKETALNFSNISVNCSHINYNRDKNGYEYNRVLHMLLTGGGQARIGKVTIHLHHTTRLLQLQGSAMMPDGNTAPVWFLNTFVKERFTRIARDKRYDITTLNEAIRKIVDKDVITEVTSNICSLCTRLFTTKAKPTKCPTCSQYFHRTNCLPVHTAGCKTKDQGASPIPISTPSTSPVSPRILVSPSTSGVLPINMNSGPASRNPSKRQRTVTVDSVDRICPVSSSNTSPPNIVSQNTCQSAPSVAPPILTFTAATSTISSLNADAVPFISASSAPNKTTKRTKASSKASPISPETARINFLNLELNSTKTRIVQLETDVNDRDISIKLQREKIKMLEQNQTNFVNNKHSINSHKQPSLSPENSNPQQNINNCSSFLPYSCHHPCVMSHQFPCYHAQHVPQPPSESRASNPHIDTSGILVILKEIKDSMNNMQGCLSTITTKLATSTTQATTDNDEIAGMVRISDEKEVEADNDTHPDHIETVCVEIVNDDEDSFASADEAVPDIPSPGRNLNSWALTTQQ